MAPLDNGQSLRDIRRAFGMTQRQLADTLGVRQPVVARWELGHEEIPMRRRYQLRDIFLNRNDVIHPLIERLAKRDQSVSVCTPEGLFIRAQRRIVAECRINTSEVDGRYKQDWFGNLGSVASRLSNADESKNGPVLFQLFEGDLSISNRGVAYGEMRIRGAFYDLRFDGYDQLVLASAEPIGSASGKPSRSLTSVRIGDFGV